MKISVDSARDLLERFSVEAAAQDPCVRLSVQGVYRRSPQQKIFERYLEVGSQLKLSAKDLRARPLCSPQQVSVQDLYKSSPGKISERDLLARYLYRSLKEVSWQDSGQELDKGSLGKISLWDLFTSSLHKLSWQDLCKRALGKISATISMHCLCTRSPEEVSWQHLCTRSPKSSLYKISGQALYKRSPCQDLCAKSPWPSIWQAQSAERVARAMLKFALRRNESDLTGPKCREGCTSNVKICTALQRKRSDRPKGPRKLHEQCQNSHCAATRVIWQAQSAERVARAMLKNCTAPQREWSDRPKVPRGLHEQC